MRVYFEENPMGPPLGHNVVRGVMRVMGVSMFVPAMIRSGITAASAAGTGGAGSVMAVTTVAAKAAVRLALVQSASSSHLIARRIPRRVSGIIYRLAVFVVAEEPIGRLRVCVRILAAHLGVEWRRDIGLTLQAVIIAAVLLLLLLRRR